MKNKDTRANDYDLTKEFNDRVLPHIREAMVAAGSYRMPIFCACAIKNGPKGTQYWADGLLAATDRSLSRDEMRKALLVWLRCKEDLPPQVREAIATMQDAMTAMTAEERQAYRTLLKHIKPSPAVKEAAHKMSGFAERAPEGSQVRAAIATLLHYSSVMADMDMSRQDMPALADDKLSPLARGIMAGHRFDVPKTVYSKSHELPAKAANAIESGHSDKSGTHTNS